MAKFRPKGKEVDAVQWWKLGDHPDVRPYDLHNPQDKYGYIDTLNGWEVVEPGDWIVTFSNGEVLIYDSGCFEEMFEPVEGGE